MPDADADANAEAALPSPFKACSLAEGRGIYTRSSHDERRRINTIILMVHRATVFAPG